jgi:glycine/D-amino acid oxidase-like deaminating enzyme
MSEKINIAIIGGGIIGCCVALELAKTRKDIYVF